MNKYLAIVLVVFSMSALASEEQIDCGNVVSTLDINQCASIELDLAQAELIKYLAASYKHNDYDTELIEAIKLAQNDWQTYSTSHCDSVYTQWRDGTIRVVIAISCKSDLAKQRTYEIWQNFLTYRDSTPPVLPEPKM
jgi:uncharacterized protein YecT (DUF1311 family)